MRILLDSHSIETHHASAELKNPGVCTRLEDLHKPEPGDWLDMAVRKFPSHLSDEASVPLTLGAESVF